MFYNNLSFFNTNKVKRSAKSRLLCAWIGSTCLLLIIPIKVLRWTNLRTIKNVIGIAPSFLGSGGLLFFLLSSKGKMSRLSLNQMLALVTIIALGLEFAQLLPRPGILSKLKYTFDIADIVITIISLFIAYILARFLIKVDKNG